MACARCMLAVALTFAGGRAQQLTGVVVDEHGAAIEAAAIGCVAPGEPFDCVALLREPPARSDERGRFSIERPDGSQTMLLVVAAPGRQACTTLVTNETGDELGQFVLPPGATLIGRVLDRDGEPIAGVRFAAEDRIPIRSRASRRMRTGAVSDERGMFRVPCVPRYGLRLTASRQGYEPDVRVATHESPLTIVLAEAPLVRGRVVDANGGPLADVRVELLPELLAARPRGWSNTRTDADGAFCLTAPRPPLRYRLLAQMGVTPADQFRSRVLRGEQLDVRIETTRSEDDTFALHVTDAATGERLPRFSAASQPMQLGSPTVAILITDDALRPFEGEARLPRHGDEEQFVVVRAPGHAFAIEAVEIDADGRMVVALGPEAEISGRVLDDRGQPAVGVAVRALPESNTSGSTGSIAEHWPRTDEQGRYRIGGLQPGSYQVQAYPNDRPATMPVVVEAVLGEPATLDLTVPVRVDVTAEIVADGPLPEGPAPVLTVSDWRSHNVQGISHYVPRIAPFPLQRGRTSYPLGVQQGDRVVLEVFVPSRMRVGAGTVVELGTFDVVDGAIEVKLPDLAGEVLRGRVESTTRLPVERIVLVATPTGDRERSRARRDDRIVASISGDGRFEVDLPKGDYQLQLADVETGIVFHTEHTDVAADAEDVVLRPELHWLDVQVRCTDEGAPVTVEEFEVELGRPREGEADAFAVGALRGRERDFDRRRVTTAVRRWLVPAGTLRIRGRRAPMRIGPDPLLFDYETFDQASIDVDRSEQTVQLRVPPPPSDEALQGGG